MDEILGQMLLLNEGYSSLVDFINYTLWVYGSSNTVGIVEEQTHQPSAISPSVISELALILKPPLPSSDSTTEPEPMPTSDPEPVTDLKPEPTTDPEQAKSEQVCEPVFMSVPVEILVELDSLE